MQLTGSSGLSQYASATAQTRQRKSMDEEELFGKTDKNGDGKVDQSEMAALIARMGSAQAESGQSAAGGDQQNGPSEEEIAALFAEVDSDGDGMLNLEDFTAFGEKMRANGNQPSGAPPGPPPAGGPPPSGGASSTESDEEDVAALFDAADTDGDGKVSLEEMIAFQQQMQGASQANATDSQFGLEVLTQMAQASMETLASALSGGEGTASSQLSMADILAEIRKNGSGSDEFTSLLQGIIEKAYQLDQKDAATGVSMVEAATGQA